MLIHGACLPRRSRPTAPIPDTTAVDMKDTDLPAGAKRVADDFSSVWQAYQALGAASGAAGPLDGGQQRLIKLALAIGAGSEGAVHSHARRALTEGASQAELDQIAILAITTLGFPRAMAALSWIRDVAD